MKKDFGVISCTLKKVFEPLLQTCSHCRWYKIREKTTLNTRKSRFVELDYVGNVATIGNQLEQYCNELVLICLPASWTGGVREVLPDK